MTVVNTMAVAVGLTLGVCNCAHQGIGDPIENEPAREAGTAMAADGSPAAARTYAVVDTHQLSCYGLSPQTVACPSRGLLLYGQDAQHQGNQPRYTDNGDGTVSDDVTGLMWQRGFTRVDFADAAADAARATTGGYRDWRVPTIKELYSLVDFSGNQGTGNPASPVVPSDARPFIDTSVFEFEYPTSGRYIDAQYVSSTVYVHTVMGGQAAFFGLNLADGRIKGYPQAGHRGGPFYARYVRGATSYGKNTLVDNGDGTVTDRATGLMWSRADSGDTRFGGALSGSLRQDGSLSWSEALEFASSQRLAGHDDWRLPNAKELHTIVDYSRAPDVTGTAAIDPAFTSTTIVNEAGQQDFAGYWTSTSFLPGADAVVIYFGRALGYFDIGDGNGQQFYDVHGAGAQRSDAKLGVPTYGTGPQGDVRRVYNLVRLVRDAR